MEKTQAFIEKARVIHGDRYDYTGVVYTKRLQKVPIRCALHGEFLQTPGNHLSGQGCPHCGSARRAAAASSRSVGTETFIARAREAHGDRYGYAEVAYKGQDEVVTITCAVHGNFNQMPKVHTRGHGCPACARSAVTGIVRDSGKTIALLARQYPGIDFSQSVYTGNDQPITARCPVHGPITKLTTAWRMGGCKQCASTKHRDNTYGYEPNERKREVHKRKFLAHLQNHPEFNTSKMVYVDQKTPVQLHCRTHNYEFWPTPRNMILKNTGCDLCGDAKVAAHKFTRGGEFLNRATAIHGDKFDYSRVVYKGTHTKVELVCAKHGSFWVKPHAHITAECGCPRCGQASSGEDDMAAQLIAAGIRVERRNRKLLAPKEVDIYLPDFKLGIEFHGLYWHTEDRVGDLHYLKWEAAQRAGIRLVQIFEDEWNTKREVVLGKLLSLAGVGGRTDARKCELAPVESTAVRVFMTNNHIQGAGSPHKKAYGLWRNGAVVAVMTFGPSRTGAMTSTASGARWELLRYATSMRVRGGFTRLLRAFCREHPGAEVVSYCDLRWGDGRTYDKAGFVLDSISNPDYYWLPSNTSKSRVPRYRTQKHKLATHPVLQEFYHPERTEAEICAAAGWKKILGVGQQRWILIAGKTA